MKKKLLLFKTLRKDITILFIVSLATILSLDFWLKGIPEFFNGGAKIGEIVYKLCMSYISAFIFYFLVVHIKAQKDKLNLYTYVARKVDMVIGSCLGMIDDLSKTAGVTIQGRYPTEEELTTISNSINPNANAPLLIAIGNYANWMQYFDNQKQRSNEATAKVFLKMPFLDTKLVNLLAKIEDCSFFMVIRMIVHRMPIKNSNLDAFKQNISDYFELIKQLEKYSEEKLKHYR